MYQVGKVWIEELILFREIAKKWVEALEGAGSNRTKSALNRTKSAPEPKEKGQLQGASNFYKPADLDTGLTQRKGGRSGTVASSNKEPEKAPLKGSNSRRYRWSEPEWLMRFEIIKHQKCSQAARLFYCRIVLCNHNSSCCQQ